MWHEMISEWRHKIPRDDSSGALFLCDTWIGVRSLAGNGNERHGSKRKRKRERGINESPRENKRQLERKSGIAYCSAAPLLSQLHSPPSFGHGPYHHTRPGTDCDYDYRDGVAHVSAHIRAPYLALLTASMCSTSAWENVPSSPLWGGRPLWGLLFFIKFFNPYFCSIDSATLTINNNKN